MLRASLIFSLVTTITNCIMKSAADRCTHSAQTLRARTTAASAAFVTTAFAPTAFVFAVSMIEEVLVLAASLPRLLVARLAGCSFFRRFARYWSESGESCFFRPWRRSRSRSTSTKRCSEIWVSAAPTTTIIVAIKELLRPRIWVRIPAGLLKRRCPFWKRRCSSLFPRRRWARGQRVDGFGANAGPRRRRWVREAGWRWRWGLR
jgi:hypothetical protein